ncbi:RICIN domain-containing protein [Streptomyces sp. NBC_00114]|uniref:RICIN domain-containing protein n=1 Tax=Streptomyces sp. NBC_00114 TaxID=2975656 RepID=UPI00386A451F
MPPPNVHAWRGSGRAAQWNRGRTRDVGRGRAGEHTGDGGLVRPRRSAPLQLWSYSGGHNQQWQLVREVSGRHHLVARHNGKCLSAVAAPADGVQLTQRACAGSAVQGFQLTAQP